MPIIIGEKKTVMVNKCESSKELQEALAGDRIIDFIGYGELREHLRESVNQIDEATAPRVYHYSKIIEIYGDLGIAALRYYGCAEKALTCVQFGYVGEYDTLEAFAEDYILELNSLENRFFCCLDLEKVAEILFKHGDYSAITSSRDSYYVFRHV
jgi:hypothetical protein